MTFWFNRKIDGKKRYCSKSISFRWRPEHWRMVKMYTNGARKGIDKCYDLNIHFLGIFFSYTNWDYNIKPNTNGAE
jgi:hypothetical protein